MLKPHGHNLIVFKKALKYAIFLIIVVNTTPVSAQEKEPEQIKRATHIQMVPMMIPAGNTAAPMTFILEAKKKKQVEAICERMPRIRDAVLSVLSRNPIAVRKRRIILNGVAERILPSMNRAVGKPYIRKVYIYRGAIRLGERKIKSRRNAVIDGCVNILRSELERRQAEKVKE